ncbi:MAG: hypothetical protein ACT4OS_10425 [Acidimicrobiales bacterium]
MKRPGRPRQVAVGLVAVAFTAGIVAEFRNTDRVSTPADTQAAAELVATLRRGQEEIHHAVYETTSPDGTGRLAIWRRPPQLRQRVLGVVDGQRSISEVFVEPDAVVACSQVETEPWSCTRSTELAGEIDPFGPTPDDSLDGERVRARDATVADRPARCFEVEVPDEAPSEACLDAKGLLLSLSTETASSRLLSLEAEVVDSDFVPPAVPVDLETAEGIGPEAAQPGDAVPVDPAAPAGGSPPNQ